MRSLPLMAFFGHDAMSDLSPQCAQKADITGGIKAIEGIASTGLAPFTGGASLAIGCAAASAVGDASGIGGLY